MVVIDFLRDKALYRMCWSKKKFYTKSQVRKTVFILNTKDGCYPAKYYTCPVCHYYHTATKG